MRKYSRKINIAVFLILLILQIIVTTAGILPGFTMSKFFNEQLHTYDWGSDVTIHINAPDPDSLDINKPTSLILYALPNGNTIAWTIGKEAGPDEDWHYEIQHIGAQTRYLRHKIHDKNIVVAYLANSDQSWPAWRAKHANNPQLIHEIVQSVRNKIEGYQHKVVLTGHSGGGSFTFGFLNGCDSIPDYVDRISFLDSDYAYSDASGHGDKLAEWLARSDHHYLCTIAYNDSIALYNGQPIVSPTGGTWYRSKMMYRKLSEYFNFTNESNSNFLQYFALNKRIQFRLKENPTRAILHTVQVERNGFIQAICSGTEYEEVGYTYYGNHVYDKYIEKLPPENLYSLSLNNINGNLQLCFQPVPHGNQYLISIGKDGINYPDTVIIEDSTNVFDELGADSLYFFRVRATSFWGKSDQSEILAATTGIGAPEILIIDGYDEDDYRNTGEFIRQHALAFYSAGHSLISATNDAVSKGMVNMNEYPIVDYFAGRDKYLDETVSESEQILFRNYLQNGGELLYSGMNVGYDLVNRGRDYEKEFCRNYFKLDYANRSPLGAISTYYQVEFIPGKYFFSDSFYFDDGNHGSYNVDRPNCLRPINGSEPFLKFVGVDTSEGVAGVCFSGLFPEGTEPGKIVVTSIPIESIYPEEARTDFVSDVMDYFSYVTEIKSAAKSQPKLFSLNQNYPNPFNPSTVITFRIPQKSDINLSIYNILGNRIAVLTDGRKEPGEYQVTWNARKFSSGIYYYILTSGETTIVKKCMLLK